MSQSVPMPALGESVTEGTVTRWLKQVGDQVTVDEPLVEVSTDKVDTEIPSPIAGTVLEILVAEDETAAVGAPLVRIGDADDQPAGDSGGQGAAAEAEPGSQESRGDSHAEPSSEQGGQGAASVDSQAGSADSAVQGAPLAMPQSSWDKPAAATTTAGSDDSADAATPSDGTTAASADTPAAATAAPESDSGTPEDSQAQGATVAVTMPALGESVTEGTVTRWLAQVGDEVQIDQPLLEISTDKVDTEVPSPANGVLTDIAIDEDSTAHVGATLATIRTSTDETSDAPAAPAPAAAGSSADRTSTDESAESPTDSAAAPTEVPAPRPSPVTGSVSLPAPTEPQPGDDGSGDVVNPQAAAESAPTESDPPANPDSVAAQEEPTGSIPTRPQPGSEPENAEPAKAAGAGTGSSQPEETSDADADAGVQPGVSAYVTPLVRRMAAERNVDLDTVTGTGVGGRIRKQDVLDAAAAAANKPATEAQPQFSVPAPKQQADPQAAELRGKTVPMSRLRKIIAERMVESLHVSAQLTSVVEVDVTKIARLRNRAKGEFLSREGVKLTFLPFFALAAVEALKQYPQLNASIEGENIVYHNEENLGLAVDTTRGLLVPVIRGAGNLNIAGIARTIADMAERTRNNKITPDELTGGTFTLTNTGSRGALFDTPIINQPQVGILGTGAVVKRPVVVTDPDGGETIAVRSMMYLSLSYDHRIVDGADAIRFLTTIKDRLEEGAFDADLGL